MTLIKTSLFLFLFGLSQLCFAQTERIITFTIKNAGIGVDGTFTDTDVKTNFDVKNLAAAYFKVEVKTKSIDTGIGLRDNHLRDEKYFDVEKYPSIVFNSESVKAQGQTFIVVGKLTIKGVTKTIKIPFEIIFNETGPKTLEGTFELDRRDYGVGKNHLILSDDVKVELRFVLEG